MDLHPHQAFVAGTVVLDHRRRYILADEVGLGKTVEAGVVIHDLLSRNPRARVLVLAPGPLVRQWLTEMATSFGGQDFRLADLHPPESVDVSGWTRLIASTGLAVGSLRDALLDGRWDMVVVDEAHHLVDAPVLYSMVRALAEGARDLLLLSAIPARRRETEFLKLLALLEPTRYGLAADADLGASANARDAHERFVQLYANQEIIGRRLNRLGAELDALAAGEAKPADVLEKAKRLADLPLLRDDRRVRSALEAIATAAETAPPALKTGSDDPPTPTPPTMAEAAAYLRNLVVDRYRIHRRILRNRRQRLVAENRLAVVTRSLRTHIYKPDQVELEAVEAVEKLVGDAVARGLPLNVARPLARTLFQALASPAGVALLLRDLLGTPVDPANVAPHEIELLNAALGPGYAAWSRLGRIMHALSGPFLDRDSLARAESAVGTWARSDASWGRERAVADLVRGRLAADVGKILVFAGYPGLAATITQSLKVAVGASVVADFRYDMDDGAKEEAARLFRVEAGVRVLVCDESGGEGRNFQFVDEIVHVDLPWQAGLVEQRIGRLDRLGRTHPEVVSHVVANEAGLEAGLLHCLGPAGIGVLTHSVSGAEFALRGLHDEMVDAAIAAGAEGTGAGTLSALARSLRLRVEEERARDESEALLDEASFQADAASAFLKPADEGVDAEVEAAFVAYFRQIATPKSVGAHGDQRTPQGLWRFQPDDVRGGGLPYLRRTRDGDALARRVGTFRRDIARARRDVEFFAPGNPLFDAVAGFLRIESVGCSYAVGCLVPRLPAAVVVEFAMTLRANSEGLSKVPGLANRAETVIGARRRSVVFPLGALKPVNEATYLALRAACRPETRGRTWDDLRPERLEGVIAGSVPDWPKYLRAAEERAKLYLRAALQPRLAPLVQAEDRRVAEQLRQIRTEMSQDGPNEVTTAEVEALSNYRRALADWVVELDGIGVLAVNP
ncbi:SNF2-related protein [Methylobacterium sp. CM6244]